MRRLPVALLVALACVPVAVSGLAGAPPRVGYTTQILPVFEKRCVGCHQGSGAGGGYQMTSRELLLKGGRHGAAIVPGKGSKSALVAYLTGEMQPRMPSAGPPLDKETIRLIERWIDEGARFDAPRALPAVKSAPSATPTVAVAARQSAPATSVQFSPDGKTLAVGGYRTVRLLDAQTGAIKQTIAGTSGQVQSLQWSADGTLAVGSGVPGVSGEVALYDASGKTLRKFATKEHTDVVMSVGWRPGTRELATGSLDKTVRVWDADTGRCLRTIKEHADAVSAVAYAPDGKMLATGSADRGVKLFDAATYKVLGALSAHSDAVTQVAFSHDGSLLATASADKTALIWKVKPGAMQNPERTVHEGEMITSCAFAPAGFVTGAANNAVKVYSGDGGKHERTLTDPTDWVYSVTFSPDGKTLAASGQGGMVYLWSATDGKLLSRVQLPPVAARVVSPQVSKK